MCGRISIDSFLSNTVSLQLGVPFNPQTNLDLRPTVVCHYSNPPNSGQNESLQVCAIWHNL